MHLWFIKLLNISEVTHKAAVAGIEGAHDACLEYGEPVEEGGRDEALHHDDQHLRQKTDVDNEIIGRYFQQTTRQAES